MKIMKDRQRNKKGVSSSPLLDFCGQSVSHMNQIALIHRKHEQIHALRWIYDLLHKNDIQ